MGLKGYQNWHNSVGGRKEETLVVLRDGELIFAKDDGRHSGVRVAEYNPIGGGCYEWQAPIKFTDGKWQPREKLHEDIINFIGDYRPDEKLIEEKISKLGGVALERIKKQYY